MLLTTPTCHCEFAAWLAVKNPSTNSLPYTSQTNELIVINANGVYDILQTGGHPIPVDKEKAEEGNGVSVTQVYSVHVWKCLTETHYYV